MKVKDREEVRRALRERVSRKIAGRGIPARVVEDAIERVLAALDAGGKLAPDSRPGPQVVVLSSTAPDLASRVRSLLGEIAPGEIASATAGRHTVVTARVSHAGREILEGAAASIPASFTLLPGSAGFPA